MVYYHLYYRQADNAAEVKNISLQFAPQVRAALLSVNNMIADVLEVGSKKAPNMEPTSIESIIQSALNDCFRFDEKSDIRLRYQFNHKHQLNVDGLKILRVFCNIVANAAQAMVFNGRIYFKTNETPGHISITIGNTNTYIPPEDRGHLFDPFYTTKKKNGTGLGLAIVQKIIAAHGGHIICRSDKIRGTEFEFDLPVAKGVKAPAGSQLPTSVAQIRDASLLLSPASNHESARMEELERRISSTRQQIRILVADDDVVYRDMIYEQINKNKIAEKVQLKVVASAEAAVAAARQFDPDIVIMDVDFGDNGKINGFQAVHEIRRNGSRGVVCIHSNHGALEFQHEAVHVGGNLFLPKPMTLFHLMTIIAESIAWRPNTGSCLAAANADGI
jgi:nitrogen-specific signal transduction histidine kinase